ncbi:hypothetical protein EDD86DRAFT_216940 [Gorgonomyces haynaldii]|nr:hypothetical protein EDD86DRAFT_216940 [Gorgonomyces haynaldii]
MIMGYLPIQDYLTVCLTSKQLLLMKRPWNPRWRMHDFYLAVRRNHPFSLDMIGSPHFDSDHQEMIDGLLYTPLEFCCRLGNLTLVAQLLRSASLPQHADSLSLRLAVRHGHNDILRLLLLDPRVDPNANEHEALRTALNTLNQEAILMLSKKAGVDDKWIQDMSCFGRAIFPHNVAARGPEKDCPVSRNQRLLPIHSTVKSINGLERAVLWHLDS